MLALFTSIMRGEVKDCVVRKGAGGDEIIPVPPKVSDRSHAAELLSKRFGLFSERVESRPRPDAADEIDALAHRLMEGDAE